MKATVIAGLVAIIAIGGAFSAFAAHRTVETSVEIELQFWVDSTNRSAFVSTAVEGEEWITHDFLVELNEYPGAPSFWVSEPVTISVPVSVEVEVEVEELALTPLPAAAPQARSPEAPTGTARCCTVRGMSDKRAEQRAISSEMRKVITFARTEMGLTHRGPITINIAHQTGGLLVRYPGRLRGGSGGAAERVRLPARGAHVLRALLPLERDRDRAGVVHSARWRRPG